MSFQPLRCKAWRRASHASVMMMCTFESFPARRELPRTPGGGDNHRMPAPRSTNVFSLQEAVGAASTLAQLRERAEASQRCLALVRHLLPAGLRDQVKPGPWGEGEWCL